MERRPKMAVLAALTCLGGLALTGVVALVLPVAQVRDSTVLQGFTALSATRVGPAATWISHLVDPGPYVVAGALAAVVALLRRRPRLALVVPLAMLGAAATAELLKPLLAQSRYSEWLGSDTHSLTASWPSGHATAAMMIALCAVLVAPPLLKPLAALLGTALAIGVSYSILVLGWHFPSDVLGGFLLAGAWTSAAVAIIWWAEARWPARSGREAVRRVGGALAPAALTALAAAGAFAALAMHGRFAARYLAQNLSFTVGAGAIALLATALAAVLTIALSDRHPAATAARSRPQPPARG